MKLREIVLLLGGMTTLLLFVAYMFDFYERSQELNLIRKDMYFDSLIMIQQIELEQRDSLFEISTRRMDSLQNSTITKRMGKREKEEWDKAIEGIRK